MSRSGQRLRTISNKQKFNYLFNAWRKLVAPFCPIKLIWKVNMFSFLPLTASQVSTNCWESRSLAAMKTDGQIRTFITSCTQQWTDWLFAMIVQLHSDYTPEIYKCANHRINRILFLLCCNYITYSVPMHTDKHIHGFWKKWISCKHQPSI